MLKAMGFHDVMNFDFITHPCDESMYLALGGLRAM